MSRGFNALKGKTITKVNASAVNEVTLMTDDERYFYLIDVEVQQNGVPVIACRKVKNVKYKLPKSADARPKLSDEQLSKLVSAMKVQTPHPLVGQFSHVKIQPAPYSKTPNAETEAAMHEARAMQPLRKVTRAESDEAARRAGILTPTGRLSKRYK